MIRTVLFSWAFLLLALALCAAPAFAAPTVAQLGNAHVAVVVSPDPPVVGSDMVTVEVSGALLSALTGTTVRYSTIMPSMNMGGPSGTASRVPGRQDEWRFSVDLGMAAPWTLRVQFSGGITGTVNADVMVGKASGPSSNSAPGASTTSMSSDPSTGGDDSGAWRNATLALIAVIVVGGSILWRNRLPLTIGLVVAAGLIVVGIAFAQARYGSGSMDMASMQSVSGSAPVPVTFARVGADAGTATVHAPGNVQPYLIQSIVARAPGVLTEFNAYTGDRLAAGAVVAHLEEPELQNNAKAAQAAARAASNQRSSAQDDVAAMQADVAAQRDKLRYWDAEISRERSLLNAGAVSVQEYQDERAQASAARSAYASARAKLAGAGATVRAAQAQAEQAAASAQSQAVTAGYTNVVVPANSVVMKRLVDPGVYVLAGTPLLQVAVVDRLRVQAQLAQQDLAGVEIGTPVDVTLRDGKVLRTRVSSLSPVVDPSTHTAIAEAIVPNANHFYQPGGFVNVILYPRSHSHVNAFSVPSGSIVGGANTAVWVDRDGSAHRVGITVLSDDGTTAQVAGRLKPGMRVVVTGASDLEEGQPITESTP
ncbi:efflux RND transporter periplasmic adaptor subunit [bacterium]|nr:MAG: efflux RND transporter periplasmic adaptor subunit [bacterium]